MNLKPCVSVTRYLAVMLCAGLLTGCAGRTQKKEDPWGGGTGTSTVFELDRGDALLERAHQARMEGDYKTAETNYRSAYSDKGLDDDTRAQALFGLAETFSALTNPRKDFDRALALYRTLVVEFPTSELRLRAERRVKEVKELIGKAQDAE